MSHLPTGIDYYGLDISEKYITSALNRYGDRGKFIVGRLDSDALGQLPAADIVLAIGVLHHMDDREILDMLALARQALSPNGRMITIDACLVRGQNPIAKFLIQRDRGQNVRDPIGYENLAKKAFPHVEGQLHHQQWIPWTHWTMSCSK